MRSLIALLILSPATLLHAEDDGGRERPTTHEEKQSEQDPITLRALTHLEKRMKIEFSIPFPADFDTDPYRKRPLALFPLDGAKVHVSRPIVNPYDEPRTVEWMIAPADPALLANQSVDCSFDLDAHGEFSRWNLLADWASDDSGNHQIERGEAESTADFFERARLTYQSRAKKAKDPAQADLFLSAFVKMATVIRTLRKEEAAALPQ